MIKPFVNHVINHVFIFTLRIFRWLQESPRISWVRFLRSLVFLLPLFQPPLVEPSFSTENKEKLRFRFENKFKLRTSVLIMFSLFKVYRRGFTVREHLLLNLLVIIIVCLVHWYRLKDFYFIIIQSYVIKSPP